MSRLGLGIGLAFATAMAACATAPAPAGHDRLEGTWRAVAAERNGAPAADLIGHELTFAGDRFRITRAGSLLFGGSWSQDPAATPPRIEFHQNEGATLRGTWRGLYRLEAGRLEIVDNAADISRPAPTAFATAPNSGYVLLQFIRK